MYKLSIHNVGPIVEAHVELRKYCVLIGPQSSGKSTIAKLISFCLWLEKDVMLRGGQVHVNAQFMRVQLLEYHKLSSFFSADSSFEYEGPHISLSYRSPDDFTLHLFADDSSARLCRIAYIPAERNFVSIPNITSLKLPDNYVRDFIFEWLGLRSKFSSNQTLALPGLVEEYSYNSGSGDLIKLPGGKTIQLADASSGVQSIVPLTASVRYNTWWVYNNNEDIAYEKYASKLTETLDKGSRDMLKAYRTRPDMFNTDALKELADYFDRMTHPHLTHLIVEEPEQNLFPLTQYELVKYLMASVNSRPGSTLLMTTHSPYILTSFNNLIQAADRDDKGEAIVGRNVSADYADVTAYEVRDGQAISICDNEFRMIEAEAIDSASRVISGDFDNLLQ